MKKIFTFIVVLSAAAMVSCCGNSNSKQAEGEAAAETTAVEAAATPCDSTACEKCDSTACEGAAAAEEAAPAQAE